MTEDARNRWRRVKSIFDEVADASSSSQQTLLAQCCGPDGDVRAEVDRLLKLRRRDSLVLDRPCFEAGTATGRYGAGELVAGRYRIGARLGSGGMGDVYAAVDTALGGQPVALKTLRLGQESEEVRARFRREVRLARQIQHANVCQVFALGEHAGDLFCVMELLAGETLAERLARTGRLAPAEALPMALQICQGLEAAHRAGVIHRDLKPGNIILAGDRAVIIDFGLAAGRLPDQALTQDGAVIGTLAYMAPEQMESGGGPGGGTAADVYSLGVVLFEMLTGQKPHHAQSPLRLAVQKAREGHRGPNFATRNVPPVWREVIAGCLHADPAKRMASAQAVHDRLQRGRPSLRFTATRRRVWMPVAALLAVAATAFGWHWWRSDPTPQPEAGALYAQAQAAMVEASPMRAIGLLERAHRRDPQFLSAQALLAVAYAEVDQHDKAAAALLEATATRDRKWRLGVTESLRLNAARAALVRDFAGAATHYRALSEQVTGQEKGQALALMASLLEQAGQADDALKALEQVVRQDPANLAARVRYARVLAHRQRVPAAAEQLAFAGQAYQRNGNREGLANLLLARTSALGRESAADRLDLGRVLELSQQTGNRYHHLTAQFRLAMLDVRERAYDQGIAAARQATARAQREGLDGLAAAGMGDLGYALLTAHRVPEAVAVLTESVTLAEEAKSYATLAGNRIMLGEALRHPEVRRVKEAIAVTEPGIAWYRQNHYENELPLILLKWGTVLSSDSTRIDEAGAVFREALDRSKALGDDSRQAMALQRLGGFYYQRDVRQAVLYWDQAVVLARRTGLVMVLAQAADAHSAIGEYRLAAGLLAEFDRTVAKLEPGPDRAQRAQRSRHAASDLAYYQGDCRADATLPEGFRARADACRPDSPDAAIRAHRRSFETTAQESDARGDEMNASGYWKLAADMALRLRDWRGAERLALLAIARAQSTKRTVTELEATLVLRAARFQLGDRAAASSLTQRCRELATQAGFPPPAEQFGGRQDLRRLWLRVPFGHAQPTAPAVGRVVLPTSR